MSLQNPNSYPYIINTTTTQNHPIITPTHLQNTKNQKITLPNLLNYLTQNNPHHKTKPHYTPTIYLNPNYPLFLKTPYSQTPYSQIHSIIISTLNFSIYKQIPNSKNNPYNHYINYNQILTYNFNNPYFYNLKTSSHKKLKIKIPYLN
jgi:hypothetical protein